YDSLLIESLDRIVNEAFQTVLGKEVVGKTSVIFDLARFNVHFDLLLNVIYRHSSDRLAVLDLFDLFNLHALLQFITVIDNLEFRRTLILLMEIADDAWIRQIPPRLLLEIYFD